jgi:hypothetical protein
MGYIFGPNYIKANKRWLGIKRDSKILIDACSSIVSGGAKYVWAPAYDTYFQEAGSAPFSHDFLFGQTTPVATVAYGQETILIYKIESKWCKPSFCMNYTDYGWTDPLTAQGAELIDQDGVRHIINSSSEDKVLSDCDRVRLIIPKATTYAIVCSTTSGSSNASRNPFTRSGGGYSTSHATPGRALFIQKWSDLIGGSIPFTTALTPNLPGATVNAPVATYPGWFKTDHNGTVTTTNYTDSNYGFYFRQETSSSNPLRIVYQALHQVRATINGKLTELVTGQLIQSMTDLEYNANNANHFQFIYRPLDVVPSGADYRHWGYVTVIDDLKLERTTLQY